MRQRGPRPWTAVGAIGLVGLLCLPGVGRAGKADAVDRQVAQGKADQGRARCDKLGVVAPSSDDRALFEACARAFWPAVQADGSAAAWAAFGQRFEGSALSARARVEEAAATLAEVPARSTEQDLLLLAQRYSGTPSADGFTRRAANAAVRDAKTASEAVEAARRYPTHPELPVLVEAWPDAFLVVDPDAAHPRVRTRPPVKLEGEFAPRVAVVGREPGGGAEDWDAAAGRLAAGWGVPEGRLSAWTSGEARPALPLCWGPGQPTGWGPYLKVSVGSGSFYQRLPWADGCGPDAWPVFLSYAYGQAIGISLRPGHSVDLQSIADSDGRRNVRGFLAISDSAPRIENGLLFQETDTAWVVTPLAGGAPWATRSGPGGTAVPLGEALRGAALPEGWVVDTGPDAYTVSSPALARLPDSLRDWRLLPGDIRVPPPLVQAVVGLQPRDARAAAAPAPALGRRLWRRTPGGVVLREPPEGAGIAGLYQMSAADIDAARGLVRGVGFPDEWITVLDGWKADVDADGTPELFLRAEIDGAGVLFAVDLVAPDSGRPGAPARVFVLEAPRVKADARTADMPFSFRRGEFVYLAWGGAEVTGATSRRHFVNVVRFDGTGFQLEDIDLD